MVKKKKKKSKDSVCGIILKFFTLGILMLTLLLSWFSVFDSFWFSKFKLIVILVICLCLLVKISALIGRWLNSMLCNEEGTPECLHGFPSSNYCRDCTICSSLTYFHIFKMISYYSHILLDLCLSLSVYIHGICAYILKLLFQKTLYIVYISR